MFFADDPDVLAPADSLITWHRDGAVRIRMADSGPAAVKPISTMTAFRETTEKVPNDPAMGKNPIRVLLPGTFNVMNDLTRAFTSIYSN